MRHTNSSKVGNRGKREGQKNQRDCFDNNKQGLSKPATKKINKQMKNSLSNGINQWCYIYSPVFSPPLASLTDCSLEDGQPHHYVWLLQWLSVIQEYMLERKNNGLNKPFFFCLSRGSKYEHFKGQKLKPNFVLSIRAAK